VIIECIEKIKEHQTFPQSTKEKLDKNGNGEHEIPTNNV